jgi:hypothetical protein
MDTETVHAKMLAQVDTAKRSAMAGVFGWAFEVDDVTVCVALRPRRRPDLVYFLRARFDDFPRLAPSCIFVDRATRQPTEVAWPPGVQHGNTGGICTPGTREFHEQLHRNDAHYPWSPDRYPFLATLVEIHRMMEKGVGG